VEQAVAGAWQHEWVQPHPLLRTLALTAVAGGAVVGYSSIVERNWFTLRNYEIPLLPADAKPLRVLHISDAHLTPGRHRMISWIRSLDAATQPDLVVNTGDSLAHPSAVRPFLDALGPLLDRPGVFVYGSNDLFSPLLKNPARYLWRDSSGDHKRKIPDLPWEELGQGMTAAGWLDLNNQRGRIKAGELDIDAAGIHDSHIKRDRYNEIAGPADPTADLRLGIMHSPEPRNMDRFVQDGYDLLMAGHTHGGQVCLPWYGTLVTNCGIDRARGMGLSRHPAAKGPAWLHVSGGLGTSPRAPFRLFCRPEAALLTLVPRIG
jgi:uncharacterized protein